MNSRPPKSRADPLEIAVAVQVTVFVIGVSWAFGGNADWVRTPVSLWGSVGIALAALAVARRKFRDRIRPGTLRWTAPVLALNVLVLLSCLVPGFRTLTFEGETRLLPIQVAWWLPSSARAVLALKALWLFDGIYFSCLGMALAVRHRHTLRLMFASVVGNALILSIFGIIQKLAGTSGLYFGAFPSPQDYFFSTFVYDNHWGAYVLLMTGACIGLVMRYAQGVRGEGFFKGPSFLGLVAGGLLAATVPYSGARACTVLVGLLLAVALVRGMPRISRALKASGASSAGVAIAVVLGVSAAAAGTWVIAGDMIKARATKTREQLSSMWTHEGLGTRAVLYHDTWRMARDRPLFGWGMGSYPTVFSLYNSQEAGDRLPVIYHDAHSDWLQSVAELGLVGAVLMGAAVVLPARSIRRDRMGTLPFYLLCGCALVGLYALLEFPFGNVAVQLTWWLLFIGALQYVRLTPPSSPHPPPAS